MRHARIQHGKNSEGTKLVHITMTGLFGEPYTGSFVYNEGTVSWRDRLTSDPSVELPKRVQRFVGKEDTIIVVLGFNFGYPELFVTDGQLLKCIWHNHSTHR